MDSTPIQPDKNPNPSASKLPIKRKNTQPDESSPDPVDGGAPPFKFHRIWTEPDEIRFLEVLLDCSSQNLAFPRDLGIFYARFSNTMSQPYTKSQLSEKLRRLRKKFRVMSARLAKGLDRSQLSLHDRALFDLSKRLWHPDYSATSPFSGVRSVIGLDYHGNNGSGDSVDEDVQCNKSSLVGVRVNFSPTLPMGTSNRGTIGGNGNRLDWGMESVGNVNRGGNDCGGVPIGNFCENEVVKLSEVNVEFEREEIAMEDEGNDTFDTRQNVDFGCENKIGEVVAKVVLNVFDECFKEVRGFVALRGSVRESFHKRWKQQRISELDVLGRRLRLVLENSLQKKC